MDISGYPKINQTTDGWPRSSKGLADWLWMTVERPQIMSQLDFELNFLDKTGIMYQAPIVPNGTGHIDLWNKGETGSGEYPASEIWFWEIK